MDLLELPLIRACAWGTPLVLLHGIRDPASGYLAYYETLEGVSSRWPAGRARPPRACTPNSAQTVTAYRTAQILPVHDTLHGDGQIEVAGRHLPRPPASLAEEGRTFAPLYPIHRTDATGVIYWSAREVATVLGYRRWTDFARVVQRAARAGAASDDRVAHFRPSGAAGRAPADGHLSRLALDLVVQSANPRHVPVAQAQTYLAIQTRRAELSESVTPLVPAAGAPSSPRRFGSAPGRGTGSRPALHPAGPHQRSQVAAPQHARQCQHYP
jgi:hypothetical protein